MKASLLLAAAVLPLVGCVQTTDGVAYRGPGYGYDRGLSYRGVDRETNVTNVEERNVTRVNNVTRVDRNTARANARAQQRAANAAEYRQQRAENVAEARQDRAANRAEARAKAKSRQQDNNG